MSDITSRPYRPVRACERCCFNRGEHAEWCSVATWLKAPQWAIDVARDIEARKADCTELDRLAAL